MKKITLTILSFFVFLGLWSQPLLLEENFNYPTGTMLVGTNGWVEQGTSTTNEFTIISGNLNYPSYESSNIGNYLEIKNSGEDAYKAFIAQNTGTVYAAFLINVTDAKTAGDYFFAFQPSPGNTNYTGRFFVKKDANNALAFGISKGTETTVFTNFTYALNTTYLIVIKYELIAGTQNDVISVFVNPPVPSTEPSPTISTTGGTTADPSALNTILLRQGTNTNAPTLFIDGIRIATTWEEAVKEVDTQAPFVAFNPADGTNNVSVTIQPSIIFSEPVRNIDNSPIDNTNAANLITFKLNDVNGQNVPFTATINANKTIITVIPDNNLNYNQTYFLQIASVEDNSDNATSPLSITFTTETANNEAEILSFTISNQISSNINSTNATVYVVMPQGTNLTNLTPTITVSAGATINPPSGTPQNFTNPATYTVTAQDGITTKNWTVTITTQLSSEAEILSFTIPNQISSNINSSNATINVVMPYGTNLTNLTPTITISAGASINPPSGTPQNFTNPVTYTVTAQDGITTKFWTVNVNVQPASNDAEILTFNIPGQISSNINSTNATVSVVMPYGTNLTNLTPTITISAFATINPPSGVAQNFTNPVTYTVTAQSGIIKTWNVSVTNQLNNEAEILSFTITNQISSDINSQNATVNVTMPYGTDVTNLTPTITISAGATINPASGVVQNFSNPVIYTVTAENGTTKIWTVTVAQNNPVYETVVEWTFPNNPDDSLADGGIPANLDKIITCTASGTITYNVSGATTSCARVTGWDNGADTKFWRVDFTTQGFKMLQLSSKQRSSSTGPKDFKVQYMINNDGNWIDVPNATVTAADNFTTGVLNNIELPSECNNKAIVSLRWIMTSNISVNGGTVASAGSSRIDDIIIKGVAIPLSLTNSEISTKLTVYPNPASESLYIQSNTKILESYIITLDGKTIKKSQQPIIYVGDLQNGLYLLNVKTEHQIQTIPFVKQ